MIGLLTCLFGLALAGPIEDGDAAYAAGDHPAALLHWGQALKDARNVEDDATQVGMLIRMASAQRELGAVDLAGRALEEADRLAGRGAQRADVGLAQGRLALHVGDLDAAESAFRKAYRGYREAEAPGGAANAALNLGVARLHLGKTGPSREAFEAARTLFHTLGDAPGEADAWVDLGLVDQRDGDLRGARTRLEHAMGLYVEEKDLAGQVDAHVNLAGLANALARPEEARRHLNQALDAARARKDLGRQGDVLHQLGRIAWAGSDRKTARAHLAAAEKAYEQTGRSADALMVALDAAALLEDPQDQDLLRRAEALNDPRLEARAWVLSAREALRSGDSTVYDRANNALKRANRAGLDEVAWQAWYVIGEAKRREGDLEEAAKALEAAVDILDTQRRLLGQENAERFLSDHEPVYSALADVHLASGRPLQALVAAERLALADLPGPAPTGAAVKLARQEAWLKERLGSEVAQRGDSARAEQLRTELAQVRVAFANEVDRLRTDVADLDARVRVAPEDLEALQGELPEGVAVVQPIVLPDRLVLLVFTRESLRAVPVQVSGEQVEATLTKLTRALRAGLRNRTVLDPLADKLGGWLWTPIAEDLASADTVVVSSAGSLRQLPFSLLRHDGHYLMEQSSVVTISHVGSLRGSSSPLRVEGEGLLLVGNPDGTLPGAAEEVKALAAQFSGSAMLIGEDATRAAVLGRMEGRSTVHLATHGRIDPQRPAHSYLVLAPDESGETRLGYREIPGLAPFLGGARLVVLSACESGRPVEATGGDGVVSIQGLAAQFRRAGVETLVASLWKVDDDGTKALMQAFYAELAEGHDAAEALALAQRKLLDHPTHGTPWVWAAFVVAGDWR